MDTNSGEAATAAATAGVSFRDYPRSSVLVRSVSMQMKFHELERRRQEGFQWEGVWNVSYPNTGSRRSGGSPRTDKLRLRVEDGGEVTVYSRGVETRVPSLKVVAVKCSGDSCLGKEWAVLEALVPDGATLGRGRRLLYATKDGHSAHRWVAGELRGESEGVASFRCVVPTANGRQELVLPLRQVV